ncbi:MAG: hypothetical protein ABTQ26_06180 [Azonexus sp.]
MSWVLALVNSALVLTQARTRLERISQRLNEAHQLGRAIQYGAVINAL